MGTKKKQFFNDNVNEFIELDSNCSGVDEFEERYCTVAESLEQSLKEMQLMREGKIPKKTWRELREEVDNE